MELALSLCASQVYIILVKYREEVVFLIFSACVQNFRLFYNWQRAGAVRALVVAVGRDSRGRIGQQGAKTILNCLPSALFKPSSIHLTSTRSTKFRFSKANRQKRQRSMAKPDSSLLEVEAEIKRAEEALHADTLRFGPGNNEAPGRVRCRVNIFC